MSEVEPPQGLVLNRALIDTLRADLSALSFTVPAIESLLPGRLRRPPHGRR